MRTTFGTTIAALLFVVACSAGLLGQTPVTGTPNFGTFDQRVLETINLGNLNRHFSIPIRHKAGRGVPFNNTSATTAQSGSPSLPDQRRYGNR